MSDPRPTRPRLAFSILGLLTSEADGTFAVAVLAVLVVAVVVTLHFLPPTLPGLP